MPSLFQHFQSPPAGYGPVPFYWWVGDPLERERLAWQLDRLCAKGVRQTLISYPHHLDNSTVVGDPPLFSAEWWDLFRWFLAASRQRGMTVGFQDYTLVGPALQEIGRDTPGMEGGQMHYHARPFTGPAEARLNSEPDSRVIGAWAYPLVDRVPDVSRSRDLAQLVSTGALSWTVPDGEWLVVLVFARTNPFDPLHPQSGPRAIEKLYAPFERECPGEVGRTLKIFFQDELDFGSCLPFWSNRLFDEFSQRFGYDLRPWLPALWLDLGPTTEKVRLDYHDTVVRCLEDSYFKPVFAWHEARGTLFGNDNHGRGDIGAGRKWYGDYFRTMRWYSAPGSDDPTLEGPRNFQGIKVNSSIAHLYRRQRVWNEAFHSSGWGVTPAEVTAALAEDFVSGATVVNLHGLYYTTRGSWWEWAAPDFHFRQPYWQNCLPFNQSITRLSWLLSRGVHCCDVALLYPTAALEAQGCADRDFTPPHPEQVVSELGKFLFDRSCDFDLIDFESLLRAECVAGRLQVSGESYQALILPAMRAVRFSMLEKVRDFIQSGGVVIASGCLPTASDRIGRHDPDLQKLVEELFGPHTNSGELSIKVHPSGGQGIFVRAGYAALLEKLNASILRDVTVEASSPLHALHRRIDRRHIYFLFNPSSASFVGDVRFRVRGAVEQWDPQTGQAVVLTPLQQDSTATLLRLSLAARQSRLLVFDESAHAASLIATHAPSTKTHSRELLRFDGRWNFSLLPTLDNRHGDFRLPASAELLGPEARRFRWNEEFEPNAEWHRASFYDSAWPETTFSFGPRFLALGPLEPGTDFMGLEKKLLAQEAESADWHPYAFSLRWGIERDPFLTDRYSGPHGLKNRVPDEFIDFHHPVAGTVWYLRAHVTAQEEGAVPIVMGGRCAYQAWINGTRVLEQAEALPPGFHPPWNLPHYDAPSRTAPVYLQRGINDLLIKLVQPAGQRTRAYVAFQAPPRLPEGMALRWFTDPSTPRPSCPAPVSRRAVWLRFLAPPGLSEMTFVARGPARVWSDGMECELSRLAPLSDGTLRFRAVVSKPRPGPVSAALRIEAPLESRAGDVLPEPIQVVCGAGQIPLGDWCAQGLAAYSGRARYQNFFELPDPLPAEKIILDLGDVRATAEVHLNDRLAAELIAPPWQVDITEFVRPGSNEISVLIANTLANHYSIGIPTPYAIPSQTRSGLLGPVRLTACSSGRAPGGQQ